MRANVLNLEGEGIASAPRLDQPAKGAILSSVAPSPSEDKHELGEKP